MLGEISARRAGSARNGGLREYRRGRALTGEPEQYSVKVHCYSTAICKGADSLQSFRALRERKGRPVEELRDVAPASFLSGDARSKMTPWKVAAIFLLRARKGHESRAHLAPSKRAEREKVSFFGHTRNETLTSEGFRTSSSVRSLLALDERFELVLRQCPSPKTLNSSQDKSAVFSGLLRTWSSIKSA